MVSDSITIGFLGAGKMATALAKGWLTAGLVTPDRLWGSDPMPQARAAFHQETGVAALYDNRAVVGKSDILVLAVKPQNMPALLAEIRPAVNSTHLVVSIAAGVTLQQLADGLGSDCRLIRVMPNTPCLVGASASAYAPAASAREQDIRLVEKLLNVVGRAFPLPPGRRAPSRDPRQEW